MKGSLRYVDGILNILIVLIVVVVIWTCARTFLGHETFIRIGDFQVYQVLSGSMEPVFDMEDFIVVKKVNKEEVSIGDVITFKTEDNNFVTHRIVNMKIDNGLITVVTKGDANSVQDESVILTEANLMGKLYMRIPLMGRISKFSKSIYGFVLMACLPIVIIMGAFIAAVFRRLDKWQPEACTAKESHE